MDRLTSGSTCFRSIAYKPLPSQARFHQCDARFKGYSGSIGSGKSQALCQEAIKLSYLNAGRTGLLGAPTYPMLRDATLATFTEILNGNQIPFEHNKSENVITFSDTGSKVLLRAVDEFERLRGTNLAWFGLDELSYTVEEAWLRLEGRLRDPLATRLCGFAVWTPKGHDWVYRKFLRNPGDNYNVTVAKAFENKHILDRIPDFYERLKSSYDEQFYRQEVLGEYLTVGTNRVYNAFELEEHVRESGLDKKAPLLWALDFNVDPMCSIVAQRDGDIFKVLDEIVIPRASTHDACEEFVSRYPKHRGGLRIYGDASGNCLKTTGTTDYKMISSFFRNTGYQIEYCVPKANPLVRDRVLTMNSTLKSADGSIKMLISAKCKELISDLEEVVFKPGTTQIDKERDPKRSHLSDALGYLVWEEARHRRPVGHSTLR